MRRLGVAFLDQAANFRIDLLPSIRKCCSACRANSQEHLFLVLAVHDGAELEAPLRDGAGSGRLLNIGRGAG
jgi:hypothetical protein